jgi:DNA polymerase V
LFGLIDCNNFYASCERVFNPSLNGKPIVVLSNNDGCIIARSNEAKALGIPMGEPAYKIKELIEEKSIAIFSSNYTLYGDMSHRVMSIISGFVPEMEIYSIDEAFLHFDGFENIDLHKLGRKITTTVTHSTGIPVSLGIAPTKTLAKAANWFAKKISGYHNVCIINTDEKREKALKLLEIESVWGIGRRLSKRLRYYSINTAWDFTQKSKSWVRHQLGVTGERTWLELRGIPCIEMDKSTTKKTICTSRSFGEKLTEIEPITEAVANFAALCGEKLRKQHSLANTLLVFLHTNPFSNNQPQYSNQIFIQLPIATNDTTELVHYAREGLRTIYKAGYKYKKAGVIAGEIIPENPFQTMLFNSRNREKFQKAMSTMDSLNAIYGNRKVHVASQGFGRGWRLKNEQLSPCYTTRLTDILEVKSV